MMVNSNRIPLSPSFLDNGVLSTSPSAALEALRKKAEPPSEEEFLKAYFKCKYALNLIAKLGHHLSSPSASQLQRGIFGYIVDLVKINNGFVRMGYSNHNNLNCGGIYKKNSIMCTIQQARPCTVYIYIWLD